MLDKVSDHRQQFGRMMDLVFSREAGIAVLPSKECLEMFERHSLLDEYFLGYQHRYKMHRLIREYLRNKLDSIEEHLFQIGFYKYYTQFLFKYRRNWLLSACAFDTRQQENMRLTGSMRLIKSAKRCRRGVRKERAEGRKAYNVGQEVIRERNSRRFSFPAYL